MIAFRPGRLVREASSGAKVGERYVLDNSAWGRPELASQASVQRSFRAGSVDLQVPKPASTYDQRLLEISLRVQFTSQLETA